MRRPVLPTDVTTTARALLACAPRRRAGLACRIKRGAARARIFAQITGRSAPALGGWVFGCGRAALSFGARALLG